MKVISTTPEGTALGELGNLTRGSRVVGFRPYTQALVPIALIPGAIHIGQNARRRGQRTRALLAKNTE